MIHFSRPTGLARLAVALAATTAGAAIAAAEPPDAPDAPDAHAPHEMAMAPMMHMPSAFGPYDLRRDGSGTSWQPDATPMSGWHSMSEHGLVMVHGLINQIHDMQSGPRGGTENVMQSMLMAMAQRELPTGTLGGRAMLSLDPTMGPRGYPLLFQTGETADGVTHLVDRQHPHDALMELSASYSLPLSSDATDDSAAFIYAGLPGEPALGPGAFMHRFSGLRNPEAPLTHHWLDSTHVTFGVVTLGANRGPWKLEGSWLNGREPDQHRWNIETRAFDSWSARLSFNPTPEWALQLSTGELKSPEQLDPETRVKRITASAIYQTTIAGADWGTTLAWGRNDKRSPNGRARLPGWLLESTAVRGRHTLFGRAEQVANDELFAEGDPLHGQTFRVRKLSLGYLCDIVSTGPVRWSVGASAATFAVPAALKTAYGAHPHSLMLFVQGRL